MDNNKPTDKPIEGHIRPKAVQPPATPTRSIYEAADDDFLTEARRNESGASWLDSEVRRPGKDH